ncbi:MAG: hypothetical protein MZV65_35550 [Chromatiales bacterium]|nr:hypothetical protein [Chromatiales bacterium]
MTVPGVDWTRLSRHRFAYRVPGDGRFGLDSSVRTTLQLPAPPVAALAESERRGWQALYAALRAARPAICGSEWVEHALWRLGQIPLADSTRALAARASTSASGRATTAGSKTMCMRCSPTPGRCRARRWRSARAMRTPAGGARVPENRCARCSAPRASRPCARRI